MIINPYLFVVAGPSTSYSNPLGTGDRRALITVSTNLSTINQEPLLVDGCTTCTGEYCSGEPWTGKYFRFDFGTAHIIDEAKWYQSAGLPLGSVKWQGSNDASTWTDIGSSFALDGTSPLVMTSLNGNTTSYRYYQMAGVSGSTTSGPWLFEIEFKVSA
jgi:hypothetical protein